MEENVALRHHSCLIFLNKVLKLNYLKKKDFENQNYHKINSNSLISRSNSLIKLINIWKRHHKKLVLMLFGVFFGNLFYKSTFQIIIFSFLFKVVWEDIIVFLFSKFVFYSNCLTYKN